MSATVTLAQVTSRARDLADQPATGGFVDDARIYEQINYAMAALWDSITDAHEDYALNRQTVSVLVGTEEYNLPTDFYKSRKLYPISGGKRQPPLRRFELNDVGELVDVPTSFTSGQEYMYQYRILGKKLMLVPKPTAAFSLEFWYVPESPQFNVSVPATVIDSVFPVGWDEYLVARAAKYILAKEDSSALGAITAMEQEALSRVMSLVKPRDVGGAKVVSDLYRRWSPTYR